MDQTEELAYSLIALAFPLVFRYSLSLFTRKRSPKVADIQRPPRPKSVPDHLSTSLFLALACYHFYQMSIVPYSFLSVLKVGVKTPSFQVRNSFREYMTHQFPGWKPPTGILENDSPSKELFNEDTWKNKIQPLESLYDKLRASKWRKWYGR